MGKIVAIVNQKGGVGKTTTAINISACIAQKGKKVMLIDLDPQGNATSGMGIDKRSLKNSVYDVLINGMDIKDAMIATMLDNFFLLPSNIDLVGAEIEMVSVMARETVLSRVLDKCCDEFDFIFIDCPPSLGLLTLNALAASNEVLVPIQCEFYALEGLSQLVNTIKLVKQHINPSLEMEGVVLTMYDGRTNLSIQVVEEVKKYFRDKVHMAIIPRNVRLGEAPSHGLPITLYDQKCVGAEAYTDLAEEIIGGTAY